MVLGKKWLHTSTALRDLSAKAKTNAQRACFSRTNAIKFIRN
jgi:hypothetical protein